MAKKTVLFKSKEIKDLAGVAAFLRQLADKIEGGTLVFQQGEHEVEIQLPANVRLEVDADIKPKKRVTKRSLEIEIEWSDGDQPGPLKLA